MPFITEWAPTRSELDCCVECGLCLPHCPTFRLTGDETASPRGRLNAMAAVASGVAEVDATFGRLMSFCLQCRACEAACPSLVPFGRAMEGARAELAAARPRKDGLRRLVVGRFVAAPRLIRLAGVAAGVAQRIGGRVVPRRLRAGVRGVRRLGFRSSTVRGHRSVTVGTATVGLLVGCVTDPWFGRVNDATVALLERAGYGVEAPPAQTCCGALAAHGGAAAAARRMSVVNQRAFAGFDHVVATTAGCSAHLAGYSHWGATDLGERAIDAIVLVARAIETGDLPTLEPGGRRVAVHDPCHHRHAQGITEEPRAILRAAGFEPVDVDPSGMCCGAAGLYSLDHPDTAARLGSAKATEVLATGCDLVASANAGCEIQLRSHLGGSIRVAHPLEIYAEALGLIAPMAE